MKTTLYLALALLFVSVSFVSCDKGPDTYTDTDTDTDDETTVALMEEEEFFQDEIPSLDEWAQQEWQEAEWEEEEEPIELETTGGLKEAMAATSRAMRKLTRSVKKDDFEEVIDSGTRVEDLIAGRCVTLYFKQHPSGIPTDFIIIGDRFRTSIQALVREAKAGRAEGVRDEYVKVKATCKGCHDLFKEEE
jgi:hypothetical protein